MNKDPLHAAHNGKAKLTHTVANRSLAQSYAALPARTRLGISLALCAIGITGIYVSDYLEKRMPLPPKTSDQP